jgi:hypothetical protein
MTSSPASSGVRRTLWLAGLVFLLTFTAAGGLAVTWFRTSAEPRIILLGSDGAVSILVMAGSSRLLIATGDNTTAFDNALDAALPPTIRRIDVLLVPGGGQGETVAAHALRTRDARYRAFIGPPRSSMLEFESSDAIDSLVTPRRFELADGVRVTLQVDPDGGADDRVHWRATVRHGDTSVIILANGADLAGFEPVEFISALVLVRGAPDGTLADFDLHALVLNEENTRKTTWRQDLARSAPPALIVLPVADGNVETLRFVEGGLQLPEAARPLPTVVPMSDDISPDEQQNSISPGVIRGRFTPVLTAPPVSVRTLL